MEKRNENLFDPLKSTRSTGVMQLLKHTGLLLVLIVAQLIGLSFFAIAQQITVSGTVKDLKGMTLPGVTVQIKGTTTGTLSDVNGKFSLQNVAKTATLSFSFVGMVTLEIPVDGKSIINASLAEENIGLEEVVIVAYGTTSKRALIGSTATISSAQLSKINTSSITQSLQGLSTGVQVFSTDGAPGSEAQVMVRGITSFNASNDPLYIVDGAPYAGKLNQISSADIESISILKDAAANSLYGSRASGGVIVITTKKGKDAVGSIHFSARWGKTDFAVEFPKASSPQETYELQWKGLYQGQLQNGKDDATSRLYATNNVVAQFFPQFNAAIKAATGRTFYNCYDTDTPVGIDGKVKPDAKFLWPEENFDWYGNLFKKGLMQEYNIDFSGKAGDKTRYYFSANYLNDGGIYTTQEFKRISDRLNVSTDVKKWLRFNANVAFGRTFSNDPAAYVRFYRTMPAVNGVWVWDYTKNDYWLDSYGNKIPDNARDPNGEKTRNAWQLWEQQRQGSYKNDYGWNYTGIFNDNFNTTDFVEVDLMKGLRFKSTIALNYGIDNRTWYTSMYSDKAGPGNVSKNSNSNITVTWNNLLTYDKSFGNHNLNILLGHELFDQQWNYLGAGKKGFPMDGLYELDAATTVTSASSSFDEYKLISFFGRGEYNFKNKYYVGGSVRQDGSSRFAPQTRWGTFWSGSLAWRLSEESFIKGIRWINDLKIKGSIGSVGNDKIALYAYQGLFSSRPDLTNTGYLMSKLPTPELKWEKNIQTNIGVDIRMLKRVGVSLEYFIKSSKDLLFNVPLPLSTGFAGINNNIGDLSNKGIEGTLDLQVLNKTKLRWDIGFNITHLKNTINKLPNAWNPVQGNYYRGIGNSMFDWYVPVWAGLTDKGQDSWYLYVFAKDANGNYLLEKNGDKVIESQTITTNFKDVNNTVQRRISGSAIPKAYGSITNTLSWEGIDLSAAVYYSFGQTMYDGDFREATRWRPGFAVTELWKKYSWDLNGNDPSSIMPRISEQDYINNNTGQLSTQYLFKNNYVRLRNLTIGYTIPGKIAKKAGMSAFRVYFSADNLLTLASSLDRGTDPAVSLNASVNNGNDGNASFSGRKFMNFGINVTF